MNTLAVLVALLIPLTLLALVLATLSWMALRSRRSAASSLPHDVQGLRDVVEQLRAEASAGLRHQAVVRYDAFGDMGGRLSWSLALLDGSGNGVVLTSIAGRSDARTYAKNVVGWAGEQPLSAEEAEAVQLAKAA